MKEFHSSFSRGMHRSMLLHPKELKELFDAHDFSTFLPIGRALQKNAVEVSKESFLSLYTDAFQDFYLGKSIPNFTSWAILIEQESFAFFEVGDKVVIRPKLPVIQISFANFYLEKKEAKIQEKAFGSDNIFWGVKLSFFQLYMDAEQNVHNALTELASGKIFRNFLSWLRVHTLPVAFFYKGKKLLTSLRLGKKIEGVNEIPYLQKEGLQLL